MAAADCSNELTNAIASLYSYDDTACHTVNGALNSVGVHGLNFVRNADYAFPPNYKLKLSVLSNFDAKLYCDPQANVLILAFKGSISITPMNRSAIDDWYTTNALQQLGDRPLQYQAAEDVTFLVEKDWRRGEFDGVCGSGHPGFMLTGHSKGGGEAQYAAVKNRLEAAVFNSAPVNPIVFSDWTLMPEASLIARRVSAVRACGGWSPADVRAYAAYFATGRIRDVRMVNDPLTNYLFPVCGSALPRAPIAWLFNTLTCSSDGHGIETVVRELQVCAH